VDHGLRAEAAIELDGAERLAASLGVPFRRTRVSVRPGGNLQARAREARRAALEAARTSDGAAVIATAHHADDRAETVLIRLLHGAGPGALAVLPARDGILVRPFVRARKTDVVEHLARHHVPHANDPSNRDPRFLRVRVRLELIPLLEELSPGIVNHLTSLADALAGGQASSAWRPGYGGLRRAHLEALERALRLGKGARIRLPGNLDLAVDPEGPEISVDVAASLPRGERGKRGKR
jgi:tRNA(Ile)-lysidine synthase